MPELLHPHLDLLVGNADAAQCLAQLRARQPDQRRLFSCERAQRIAGFDVDQVNSGHNPVRL
jgi:hypothetical protein